MKRLIINILAAVCCAAYSMPNVSAQDYIDYSDYISYEDIETLDIQPIVKYNNNFNYYHFADYAVIINRVMEYGGISQVRADVIYEDDDSISEWAKDSVYNIAGSDIMYGDGVYFKPQDNCSKEQAIAALMRLYYCFE